MTDNLFKIMQQIQLADINMKHNKELQKAVVKTRMDTTHDLLRKIQPQINLVVTSLYNELEEIHHMQREKMIADFNNIIRYLLYKYYKFRKVLDALRNILIW